MLTPDETRARLRTAIDAFNAGSLDTYLSSYARDAVIHGLPEPFEANLSGHRQYLTMMRRAMPDMTVALDEVIVEGHTLAARMTYRGTHLGELSGVHPTGRILTWAAMTFRRYDDAGLVVERWILGDTLSLLRQLGSDPAARLTTMDAAPGRR